VPASRPSHILIVEDNQLVIDALTIVFDASGRRVVGARSIAEALAMTDTDPAALVLLDLGLPDGDGLSLIGPLRGAGCMVVALTGDDDPGKRQRCLDAGCLDVLVKPVAVKKLMSLAEQWIDRRPD
jgi:DNA-binding response OmpR family regulator